MTRRTAFAERESLVRSVVPIWLIELPSPRSFPGAVCWPRKLSEDDYEKNRGQSLFSQKQHIQPNRQDKNHTDKRVALEERPIDPRQIQISCRSVFVK